jgi:hypothetical protein
MKPEVPLTVWLFFVTLYAAYPIEMRKIRGETMTYLQVMQPVLTLGPHFLGFEGQSFSSGLVPILKKKRFCSQARY